MMTLFCHGIGDAGLCIRYRSGPQEIQHFVLAGRDLPVWESSCSRENVLAPAHWAGAKSGDDGRRCRFERIMVIIQKVV